MLMLAATGLLQRFGDMIVVGLVLAMVAYGVQFGLFLAVIAGMHALTSIVVALAFAEPLAAVLAAMELPAAYAFPAAFGTLLIGTAMAIRLAVGAVVPADQVRFAPTIDKVGGGLMGALAGLVVAGTVLIASSILPLSTALRLDGSKLQFDLGTRLLGTFARCVAVDEATRIRLLQGEPPSKSAPAGSPSCSELFSDTNANDQFDEGEPFLDADRNGSFTLQLPFVDADGKGRRDVGLVDRYRLGDWRDAKVLYAPTIDSADAVAVPAEVSDGDVVYQVVAIDMDPNETFTYGMRIDQKPGAAAPRKGGDPDDSSSDYQGADLLSIDKATGAIKIADAHEFSTRKSKQLKIVVTVTDRHGLTSEKTVTITRKAPKQDADRREAGKP